MDYALFAAPPVFNLALEFGLNWPCPPNGSFALTDEYTLSCVIAVSSLL